MQSTIFNYDEASTRELSAIILNNGFASRETDISHYPLWSTSGNGGYVSGISYLLNGSPMADSVAFTRDAFGKALSETRGGDVTGLAWDPNGNLATVTPPQDIASTLSYTPLNQLSSYVPPAPNNTAGPWSNTITYKDDRKLDTITTADLATTANSYDSITGKLSSVATTVLSAGFPIRTATYTYFLSTENASGQAPGRLKKITGPAGVDLGFSYAARLTQSETWSGLVSGSVAWTYDNDFAKASETVTVGTTSARIALGYDIDKLLTCAQSTAGVCTPGGAGALSIARDSQNGAVTSITLGGITETYTYNSFGELRSKSASFGSAPITQFTYDSNTNPRDTLGRITHKVETLGSGASTSFDYIYDSKGRLKKVTSAGATVEQYGYGLQNDNRTSSLTISYDGQDRLTT